MRKRILSVITALILCLSMFPSSALADEPQPAAEIELRQSDVNNEGTVSLADGKNYKLVGNIDITKQIEIEGTVSLDLNGYVLRQQTDYTGAIKVVSGTFTLKDSSNNTASAHYFTVAQNGLWEYAGDTQPTSGYYKTINGGVITGKRTGGGNGGVLVNASATFNMEGGNIVGYLAENSNGVYSNGGGVYNSGTFNMNGGSIKGCAGRAAGAYNEGTFTMNGGTIEYCAGLGDSIRGDYGGVYNEGTFNMKGGSIQDCTASETVTSGNFDSGCGVSNNGTMKVGGDPTKTVTIANNKNNGKEENVYLYTGKTIDVVGEMSSNSRIGISLYLSQRKDEGFKFGNTVVKDVHNLTNVSNPLTIFSGDKDDTVLEVVGNDIQLSHEHEWGPYVVDKDNNKEVSTCTVDGTSHTRERAFTMPTGDTYTISGHVQDSSGSVTGASVSVLQGDRQWASGTTDSSGNFSLSGVPAGVYNLVIKYGVFIQTVTVKVESSDVNMGTVERSGVSSILKIDNDDSSTPLLVVVDGLQALAASLSSKIEMTVSRPESSVALRNKAKDDGRTLGLIFKFDILKDNVQITDTKSLLHIYIELPEEMQNKTDFVVYRQHDYSVRSDGSGMRVDTLTTTANGDGEYVEISGKYLIIHAKYFSDYAFAYPVPVYSSSSDDNSEIFYTIEAYANENGTISPKGNVKVKYERDKTFEITADDGYEIEKVLVDGDDVGAVDTYTFENVRRRHTIEAFFKEAEEIVEIKEEENKFLPDGLNYEDHIAYVSGYEDEFVRPEKAVTRAEAAMMLYRLLTEECLDKIGTNIHHFTDVNADDWYCEAVATMANGGYINGYKDGTFGGDKLITRAEFVAILVRFVGEMDVECDFTDLDESHWAYRAIATAVEAGWIAGFEDGSFRPEKPITRAEVMAVINRALNRGVDEDSELLDYKIWPDNFPGKWYYYEVVEATNSHDYVGERPSENWIEVK